MHCIAGKTTAGKKQRRDQIHAGRLRQHLEFAVAALQNLSMCIVHNNDLVVVVGTLALHKVAFGQRALIDPIALGGESTRPSVILTHAFRGQKPSQKTVFLLRTRKTEVQLTSLQEADPCLIDESQTLSGKRPVGIVYRGSYRACKGGQISQRAQSPNQPSHAGLTRHYRQKKGTDAEKIAGKAF